MGFPNNFDGEDPAIFRVRCSTVSPGLVWVFHFARCSHWSGKVDEAQRLLDALTALPGAAPVALLRSLLQDRLHHPGDAPSLAGQLPGGF